MKRAAVALATFAALLGALGAAGCGGDDEGRDTAAAPPSTGGTSSTATMTAPATTRPPGGAEHRRETGTAPGGEEPVRVPATFTLRNGRLAPPTVTVPPFLAILVSVRSLDARTRTVTVGLERPYRLTVAAGGHAARTLPGQRAGSYAVTVAGGGRATLVVGGEPGP